MQYIKQYSDNYQAWKESAPKYFNLHSLLNLQIFLSLSIFLLNLQFAIVDKLLLLQIEIVISLEIEGKEKWIKIPCKQWTTDMIWQQTKVQLSNIRQQIVSCSEICKADVINIQNHEAYNS